MNLTFSTMVHNVPSHWAWQNPRILRMSWHHGDVCVYQHQYSCVQPPLPQEAAVAMPWYLATICHDPAGPGLAMTLPLSGLRSGPITCTIQHNTKIMANKKKYVVDLLFFSLKSEDTCYHWTFHNSWYSKT